jgi:hypothetical protein
MYHLVLLLIVAVMAAMGWMLVRSAPPVLSLLLPRNLTFGVGAGLFIIAVFAAFTSAFALHQPEGVLDSFITLLVGVWFMFAASAGMRGSPGHDDLMKRFGAMMCLLLGLILAALYVSDPRVVSVLSLGLIGGGVYVSRDLLKLR